MKRPPLMLARSALIAWSVVTLAAPDARAQVRASESALVAQTIDGNRFTVEYSRPRARNRDSLFGKIVTWNEIWTPGANWATTFETSKDVRVGGRPVPAGKYSVWFVVRKEGPWIMVLDPRSRLYHTTHPDSTAAQIRFPVQPASAEFSESLTWSFSGLRPDGATLAMEWGKVRVPIDISVASSFPLTTSSETAAAYLGNYSFIWSGGPEASKPITLIITHENGSLMGRWDPPPFPEWDRFYLISISPETFIPGFLANGKLYDVERDMVFEFKSEGGRATEFTVRALKDQVMASGKRKS
jgi:hypothetical protein